MPISKNKKATIAAKDTAANIKYDTVTTDSD